MFQVIEDTVLSMMLLTTTSSTVLTVSLVFVLVITHIRSKLQYYQICFEVVRHFVYNCCCSKMLATYHATVNVVMVTVQV